MSLFRIFSLALFGLLYFFWQCFFPPFGTFWLFFKGGQKGREAKGRAGTQLNDDVDDEDWSFGKGI